MNVTVSAPRGLTHSKCGCLAEKKRPRARRQYSNNSSNASPRLDAVPPWRSGDSLSHAIQTEGHRVMQIKLQAALEDHVPLPIWDIGTDLDKTYGRIDHEIVDVLPGLDVG